MPGSDHRPAIRVALDATPLLGQETGIGVFTRSLLEALVRRDDIVPSAYAVSWRTRHQLADRVPAGVSTEQRAMPARPLHWLWAHSERGRAERFFGPVDVVHGTNFTVPPTKRSGRVLTVHDLTCVRFPEMCQPATLRYPAIIERALRTGALVHTPSAYVADEVRSHFRAGRDQVIPVHSGVPPRVEPDHAAALEVRPSTRPYILSAGTAEPRKDLPSLVAAFDLLSADEPDLELVLVGPSGWGSDALDEAIARASAKDRISQVGFVSAPVLSALLEGARCLAYPSIYEGFGFPPLQAMAVGVPVVTTRAGALGEIVGGAAMLCEPGDVEALADALRIAVADEAQRSVLITAGLARVADFTWERTASGMRELYERASRR